MIREAALMVIEILTTDQSEDFERYERRDGDLVDSSNEVIALYVSDKLGIDLVDGEEPPEWVVEIVNAARGEDEDVLCIESERESWIDELCERLDVDAA